jgi:hypothetical protein
MSAASRPMRARNAVHSRLRRPRRSPWGATSGAPRTSGPKILNSARSAFSRMGMLLVKAGAVGDSSRPGTVHGRARQALILIMLNGPKASIDRRITTFLSDRTEAAWA